MTKHLAHQNTPVSIWFVLCMYIYYASSSSQGLLHSALAFGLCTVYQTLTTIGMCPMFQTLTLYLLKHAQHKQGSVGYVSLLTFSFIATMKVYFICFFLSLKACSKTTNIAECFCTWYSNTSYSEKIESFTASNFQ